MAITYILSMPIIIKTTIYCIPAYYVGVLLILLPVHNDDFFFFQFCNFITSNFFCYFYLIYQTTKKSLTNIIRTKNKYKKKKNCFTIL